MNEHGNSNPKSGLRNWNRKLKIKFVDDKENPYWECPYCGARYYQPENWVPFADYCMKCKESWT